MKAVQAGWCQWSDIYINLHNLLLSMWNNHDLNSAFSGGDDRNVLTENIQEQTDQRHLLQWQAK